MLLFSCGGMSLAMATMTGYYWCFAAKEWVLVGKETWEWASFVAMTLYVLQSLPNTRSAKGWAVNSASVWRAVQQRVFDYHWSDSTRSCAEAELNRCRYMFFNRLVSALSPRLLPRRSLTQACGAWPWVWRRWARA